MTVTFPEDAPNFGSCATCGHAHNQHLENEYGLFPCVGCSCANYIGREIPDDDS